MQRDFIIPDDGSRWEDTLVAHGKALAYGQLAALVETPHTADCDCAPCSILARVADRHAFNAAFGAVKQVLYLHRQRHEVYTVMGIAEECARQSGGNVERAAGLAVAAAMRMIENSRAQADGYADAFGVDVSDRAGRYDGAV